MIYVALLRGINVGGHNKVAMKKLKATFEALGFKDVVTYINSGNIIFSSSAADQKKLAAKIEQGIKQDFKLAIKVLIRDALNIQALAQAVPQDWGNDASQKTDILFLWDEVNQKSTLGLIKANPKVDDLRYIAGAIVWHVKRKDYAQSGLQDFVGTKIYKAMTARNVNTLRKLAALMGKK